uniref:Odorant-binding protein 11 mRNA n=1 Tax=Tenebrio molitor TaxID=7067 RepID=A0A0C5BA91_TENMO|nr:odorant-binding protein 11 [Tenebrio molitor]
MKLLICVALVAAVVTAQTLTDEQKAKWKKWREECREETGVSSEGINQLRTNHFDNVDDKIKAQSLCFGRKSGLINESGDVLADQIKIKLKRVAVDDDEVDRIIKKCVVKKDTPEETAFQTFKCLREEKPKFSPV